MIEKRGKLARAVGDRYLLFKTVLLLNAIRLGLWLLPFQRLCQLLVKLSKPFFHPGKSPQLSKGKVVWVINAASLASPGQVKCLARAMASQILLTHAGYSTQLRIGVAITETGALEAHAWVEDQGRILIGDLQDLERFVPLPTFELEQL